MKLSLTLTLFILFVSACSGEDTSTAQSKADPDLTGERFFDSAASKFMAANPGLTRPKANCMVKSMTEGGVIGLGEVNSMKLDMIGLQEKPTLRDNYYAAMKKCTPS